MSLGAWIFAAVVLVLVVVNALFRKSAARAAIVLGALAVLAGTGWYGWTKWQQHKETVAANARKAAWDKSVAAWKTAEDELAPYRVPDAVVKSWKDARLFCSTLPKGTIKVNDMLFICPIVNHYTSQPSKEDLDRDGYDQYGRKTK
jgi:hypothetical protein